MLESEPKALTPSTYHLGNTLLTLISSGSALGRHCHFSFGDEQTDAARSLGTHDAC